MSAQSAEQRFRSITTIIKDLRIAGLWTEEGTGWDRDKPGKDHLNPAFKSDTQMLDTLCNMLVRGPGDVVAVLIALQQSGAQFLVAESSPCVLATNSKEPRFQAPGVAIKPPSDDKEVITFVLEHVRRFKSNNEKISFKNHVKIVMSFLKRIYEAEDKDERAQIGETLICYVLGMSLPKTIDRLYTKKAGLPQYVELFKGQFQKKLLGDMSAVLHVEDKHVKNLLHWADHLLGADPSTSYHNAALEQLKMAKPSSMKLTEEIAAVVHSILHIPLTVLFGLRMARLDHDTLLEAYQAQLDLSILLSSLKPFVMAYLKTIDPEKFEQSLSKEDSSCAILDVLDEEELCGSEDEEEANEIRLMKDDHKPWSEICFYLLKRIALISSSTLQITSPSNAHPGLNQLLKSSSVTTIEPKHHDMKMEHWEDTVDYLLKDSHNAESTRTLIENMRKIVCKTTSNIVFSNVKKGDNMKLKSTNTLKFTGAYHCELALMALLLKAKSDVQCPEDEISMRDLSFFQKVQSVKLGLSKPSCLVCDYVICRICENNSLSSVSYSGQHKHVYPCALPDSLPEPVMTETRLWIEALLRNHLISTKFQNQLDIHIESHHPATGSTASRETYASISPDLTERKMIKLSTFLKRGR